MFWMLVVTLINYSISEQSDGDLYSIECNENISIISKGKLGRTTLFWKLTKSVTVLLLLEDIRNLASAWHQELLTLFLLIYDILHCRLSIKYQSVIHNIAVTWWKTFYQIFNIIIQGGPRLTSNWYQCPNMLDCVFTQGTLWPTQYKILATWQSFAIF